MSRKWKVGICDCLTDTRTCLDHLFCTPCMMSRHWMASINSTRDTFNYSICCASICLGPFSLGLTRCEIAEKYHIDEKPCSSLCKCCLCCPLLTCQHQYELTWQGMWPGGTVFANQPPTESINATYGSKKKENVKNHQRKVPHHRDGSCNSRLPQYGTSPQGQIPTPRQHDTARIPYGPNDYRSVSTQHAVSVSPERARSSPDTMSAIYKQIKLKQLELEVEKRKQANLELMHKMRAEGGGATNSNDKMAAVTHPPYDQGSSTGMTYQV